MQTCKSSLAVAYVVDLLGNSVRCLLGWCVEILPVKTNLNLSSLKIIYVYLQS